jgi:hypothetical protein
VRDMQHKNLLEATGDAARIGGEVEHIQCRGKRSIMMQRMLQKRREHTMRRRHE